MSTPDNPASRDTEGTFPVGKLPGPILDRMINTYRTKPDAAVIVHPGYGRDAAALAIEDGQPLIVKSDPITFASDGAARFLVAVNANDIACLGGIPRWLTVVALFPEGRTRLADVEATFSDLQSACDEHDIAIIGGHTEITAGLERPILIGTMIGTAGPGGLVVPGHAHPGDDLLLTKWIGIEGTALLARERAVGLTSAVGADVVRGAAKLLRSPGISIIADVNAVRSVDGVTALHDPTEGGIATAIHELAEASDCGAEVLIDSLPILPETMLICNALGLDPLGLLSSGALLMAVRPERTSAITTAAMNAMIPIVQIGKLVERSEGLHGIRNGLRDHLPRFDVDEVTRAHLRQQDLTQ